MAKTLIRMHFSEGPTYFDPNSVTSIRQSNSKFTRIALANGEVYYKRGQMDDIANEIAERSE